jgi:hypothetical protein
MLNDLSDLFADMIGHQPVIGHDVHGEPEFGLLTGYAARISYRSRLVTSPNGERVNSRGTAIIAAAPTVAVRDRLTLSDNTTASVVAFEQTADENGALYTTVHFV